MKMKATRAVMAVLMTAFCVACTLGVAACGQSDEKKIQESLESELSGLKSADDATLNEYFSSLESTLSQLGLSSSQFFSSYLKNFDYKINGVTIDGDKATANCDITSSDFYMVLEVYSNNFEEWVASAEGNAVMSAGDDAMLYAKAGQFLMTAMDDPSITPVTTNVDIVYQLQDKVWTPIGTSDLETALLGGYTG